MTGWHKSMRALVAALMTTLLALLMHSGAGGDVSPLGAAIVFVIVLWAAMILAGRRLGYLALASILGLGQLLMHVSMGWFGSLGVSAMTHSPAEAAPGAAGGMSAADHALMAPATGTLDLAPASALGHAMDHGDGGGPVMVLAHLGAIVVTAVILKRGEDLLFSVLQLALGPVGVALRALAHARLTLDDASMRFVTEVLDLPVTITAAVVGPNYRRGPPALV